MSTEGLHRRRRVVALAVVAAAVALVVALASGGGDGAREDGDGRATSLLDALAPVLGTGARPSPPARGSEDLGVPLDRAAAQLFAVGLAGTSPQAPFLRRLRVRDWGAIVLTDRNWRGSRARLASLVRALRATARRAGHTPPLVTAVAPGGLDAPAVPGLAGPRASPVVIASAAARPLARLGVDAVLGPSFDLAYAAGPWEDLGLPEEPAEASRTAVRAVRRWRAGGIEPVPGHFPGEGAATADPRTAPASVGLGLDELRAADVAPFRAAARHVRAIQLSAAVYAGFDAVTPATLLPEAVRLLRETDPDAVAVSADLQVVALATGAPVAELAVAALRAGCDLLLVPGDAEDQELAHRAVVQAVRTGEVPRERVREALRRVASLKRTAGVAGRAPG